MNEETRSYHIDKKQNLPHPHPNRLPSISERNDIESINRITNLCKDDEILFNDRKEPCIVNSVYIPPTNYPMIEIETPREKIRYITVATSDYNYEMYKNEHRQKDSISSFDEIYRVTS